jgi:hypothetical protein
MGNVAEKTTESAQESAARDLPRCPICGRNDFPHLHPLEDGAFRELRLLYEGEVVQVRALQEQLDVALLELGAERRGHEARARELEVFRAYKARVEGEGAMRGQGQAFRHHKSQAELRKERDGWAQRLSASEERARGALAAIAEADGALREALRSCWEIYKLRESSAGGEPTPQSFLDWVSDVVRSAYCAPYAERKP